MISNFETENMEGYTVKVRTCNLKKKLYGPFLWMGFNCLKARAVRYILGISILVFQNLLAKLNMQNMYKILPTVKLQTKTTT